VHSPNGALHLKAHSTPKARFTRNGIVIRWGQIVTRALCRISDTHFMDVVAIMMGVGMFALLLLLVGGIDRI
jgi:hypothetical protein